MIPKQTQPEPVYRYSALLVYEEGRFDVTSEVASLDLLELCLASVYGSQTRLRYAVALRSYETLGRRYLEREQGDGWKPIKSIWKIQRHEIRVPRPRRVAVRTIGSRRLKLGASRGRAA